MKKTLAEKQSQVEEEIQHRKREGLPLNSQALRHGNKKERSLYGMALRCYGRWQDAIEAAGLIYDDILEFKIVYPGKKEVLRKIRRRHRKKLPLNKNGLTTDHDTGLYYAGKRLWGSWQKAIEAAGFSYDLIAKKRLFKYPTPESVIDEIKRRWRESLSLKTSGLQANVNGDYALLRAARKFFNSWPNALTVSGLDAVVISERFKYPSQDSIIKAIHARIAKRLPITTQMGLRRGMHRDRALFNAGQREFGRWIHALLAASSLCSQDEYSSIRPALERLIITEIQRRYNTALSLIPEDLQNGTKEEKAFIITVSRMFGSWENALQRADIV